MLCFVDKELEDLLLPTGAVPSLFNIASYDSKPAGGNYCQFSKFNPPEPHFSVRLEAMAFIIQVQQGLSHNLWSSWELKRRHLISSNAVWVLIGWGVSGVGDR